jgi:uncharacterized delta-60 repeat protein
VTVRAGGSRVLLSGVGVAGVVWRGVIAVAWLAFAASPAVAAPADPDPSFGQGGLALVDASQAVRGAALAPDGGIVVASDRFTATKLTRTGALDTSFGTNGTATAPVPAPQALFLSFAVVVQDDGRIVVGGTDDPVWDGSSSPHFALARFLADGTPDPTFGSGGMVVMALSAGERDSEVTALARAPGGGVIACGAVDGLQGPGRMVLARFDGAGHLDGSFGSGGLVSGPAGHCHDVARGPGGTVLVGGSLEYSVSTPTFIAARYLADGTPDPSFAAGGVASTTVPLDNACNHVNVLPQPDGKVVLTGEWDTQFELLRLDAAGRPDPTFGAAGVVTTRTSQSLHCGPAALQANGKVILGGTELVPPSDRRFAAARYLPDGSLDPSFGGGVVFSTFGSSDYADVGGLLLQPDGRIVAVANVGDSHGHAYLGAWRLLGDGPGGAPADPDALGWAPPPAPASAPPGRVSRATLRLAMTRLRHALATRRARRGLQRGGVTVHVAMPAGTRVTLTSSKRTLARGSARNLRTGLRLRTTRAGMRVLRRRGRVRVRARARLAPALAASTTIVLPGRSR